MKMTEAVMKVIKQQKSLPSSFMSAVARQENRILLDPLHMLFTTAGKICASADE